MGVRGAGCEGSRAEGPWPPLSDLRPGSAASPVPFLPRRKTMLNDLLRFDVKDCSWCRWAARPLAVPGRWQGWGTPRLPSAPRAGCKSLWLYPRTREEVSPKPSAVTAAPCQPAVLWAIGGYRSWPRGGRAAQRGRGPGSPLFLQPVGGQGDRVCCTPRAREGAKGGSHLSWLLCSALGSLSYLICASLSSSAK